MLPQLNQVKENITMMQQFLGLNRNTRIAETEFADMVNMTNDEYPVLTNRRKRGLVSKMKKLQGMLGGRYLSYVDDNKLYFNESLVCELEETNKERVLVMMGAYLVVFPDGVIFNTYTNEIDRIENKRTASNVTVTLCRMDGRLYENVYTGAEEPEDKTKHWIDTSQEPVLMKKYNESLSSWMGIATTYVRLEAEGIGIGFKAYDAANFKGIDSDENIYNNTDLNQNNIIYAAGDNYVVIEGLINNTFSNSHDVTVERKMPELDYVCEMDNRIWGCCSKRHEIYACKLGDPKNWYCYAGLDSDSYAATVGTQNVFTGCISYNNSVFFFKEDGIHRLYGTKPSNFELIWKPGRGVQEGSSRSICILNNYLIFKSRDAVCLYDGTAEPISDALGTETFYEARAGVYRDKYYISMRDIDNRWAIYVYDFTKRLWVKEDETELLYLVNTNEGLYMVDEHYNLMLCNNERIYKMLFPSEDLFPDENLYPGYQLVKAEDMEQTVEWMFETGDIGLESPYNKYVKRLNIRMKLSAKSKIRIEIMYDDSKEWEQAGEHYCTRTKTIEFPVKVKRCDHFRIRCSGFGDVKVYSIAKIVEEGSGI